MRTIEKNNKPATWRQLYEAALLELDPELLPQRIANAQEAIGERALALPANGDNNSEIDALSDARVALDDLKRIYQIEGRVA
jgi:hypothetical protein